MVNGSLRLVYYNRLTIMRHNFMDRPLALPMDLPTGLPTALPLGLPQGLFIRLAQEFAIGPGHERPLGLWLGLGWYTCGHDQFWCA